MARVFAGASGAGGKRHRARRVRIGERDRRLTIIASMFVGIAMLLVLNLPMVRVFVKLLKAPPPLLYGGVVAFTVLGAYALTFSLLMLLAIGLVGYAVQENCFPLTPAILAAVLAPLLEDNLRRTLVITNGTGPSPRSPDLRGADPRHRAPQSSSPRPPHPAAHGPRSVDT